MDSWEDRNRLLSGIDTGEDVSSLENAGEALMDLLRWQVVQVEVDVVSVGAYTASF